MSIDVDIIYIWIVTRLFLGHLYLCYGPWFMPESRFRSISLEQIDR